MRDKICTDSFRTVKTYAVSKGLVHSNRRKKGTEDLVNLVKNSYLKNLSIEFQKYRANCQGGNEKNDKLTICWNKAISGRMRNAFYWWKRRHELMELAQDLYDTGPVRAQEWNANKEIDNLKEFMRKEHYTEREIEKFHDDVCNTNEHLMNKYITRLRN